MENRRLQKWGVYLLVALMSGATFLVKAVTSTRSVDLRGYWKDIQRSVPFELPVSAYTDGLILIIRSLSTSVDITVVVSCGGKLVFEKTVPASQTSQIVVDMDGWGEGEYVLELRNKWGG